jgi:hypothetical protein
MLGITGSLRATNLVGNGTVYYTNTHIKAQGWGALSSDNVSETPRLYATNCLIEVTDSGYGAFSLGTAVCTFSKCTFKVHDMAIISQDGDGIFTDGTTVTSGRFGAMYWGSGANLTIDKGSVFNTKSTSILLKGGSTNIVVDNAKLNPENGIIIQMMANDDPNQMSGGGPGGGMPGAGGAPAAGGQGGAQGAAPGGSAPQGSPPAGGGQGGAPGGSAPQGGAPGGGGQGGQASASKDINASFSNMSLTGDIINGHTSEAGLIVVFKNATITGAITTASVKNALGPKGEKIDMKHPELYYLIGEVTNTFCAMPDDKNGVTVSLDSKSSWVINKTSYLTGLTVGQGANITAPKGFSLTMTVDGVKKTIAAGSYKGKIVITVTKNS